MTDDELDALLMPRPAPPDDALREAVFAKARPRRPWRGGRLAWPAAAAAGLAVGWFAKPTTPPERVVETIVEKEFVPVEPKPPAEPSVELPPDRLELEAEKSTDPATAAKLFRQAGDAYLKANKIESAIRCYRQHLSEAGNGGRELLADDSWLLTSIKNSKRQEN